MLWSEDTLSATPSLPLSLSLPPSLPQTSHGVLQQGVLQDGPEEHSLSEGNYIYWLH